MAQTDRTIGLIGNAAFKVPVRAATTAAITLSGAQTIDGVACVTGDRVLVKDQATASANGIYVVDTGDWSRSKDCDGSYDLVQGTLVRVVSGSTNGAGIFEVATAAPITIGTTSLAFSRIAINNIVRDSQTASAGQTVFNVGSPFPINAAGIAVYVNGLRQRVGSDYTETTTTRITFAYALLAGDEVDCYIGQSLGNVAALAASLVGITDASDYFVGATVEAALAELVDAVSADVGNADAVLTWGSSTPVQRWNTPLTANRTATLSTTNAKEGAHFVVVRGAGATGNFTLAVGVLVTLRAPGEWCEVRYDAGTGAWLLEKYGILPSAELLGVASNGDASANLTVGTSVCTQRWESALTAERSADLQAAGTYTGAGFRILRAALATGAFSLSVKTGTTTLVRLAPGQWCDVEHNGTAWALVSFGDLRQTNSALVHLREDFLGEEIDGFRWQGLVGTDAEALQAVVLADQVSGVVRLTTGDDAAATMVVNGVQLNSRLNWRANNGGLSIEIRVTLSAITSVAVFVGLTDQVAALEMPFTLAAGDALTSNATDAVGVLFDTAADTDNWWLVGVAADIDAAKQNTGAAPVAATFETWRIEIDSAGAATFFRNNVLVGATMNGAVTGSTKLTPVVAAFARGAASRSMDVDMINVTQQR